MPTKLELALCVSKGTMLDVFDIHSGIHVRHISGPLGHIAVLHDSLIVCCDSKRNIISVRNYRTDKVRWQLSIPKETRLGPLCVSSTSSSHSIPCDPRFLFCGSSSGHIYCWCLLTGQLLAMFKAHLQAITSLVMSKDGNLLLSGSNDCLCKVWKLSAIVLSEHRDSSPSGGVCSVKEYVVWKDHILGITDIVVPNAQRVFTASQDCTVKVYSLLNKQLISSMSFPNPITSIRVDPANIHLLVTSNVGHFWRIDLVQHPTFGLNADISHILESDPKTLFSDITFDTDSTAPNSKKASSRTVAITGCDISYDGRVAVCTHSNGTASLWDIKFGSKVSVFNKHRTSYDQVILVCDRLGAFAEEDGDVKYQKHALLTKSFPVRCKRFFASGSQGDDSVFRTSSGSSKSELEDGDQNKTALIYPPDYVDINIPGGMCSASELAVNEKQRESMPHLGFDAEHNGYDTAKYGGNSWWSDHGLLNRIDDEFDRLHGFNGNRNGFLVEMALSAKEEKRVKTMAQSGNAAMDRTIQTLLAENKKLKGEVHKWKVLNQNLYKFACDKISGNAQSEKMSMFSRIVK